MLQRSLNIKLWIPQGNFPLKHLEEINDNWQENLESTDIRSDPKEIILPNQSVTCYSFLYFALYEQGYYNIYWWSLSDIL